MAKPTLSKNVKVFLIWGNVAIGVLILCAVLLGGAAVAYERMFDQKMFPGVRVLGVKLDGLSKEEAHTTVLKAIDASIENGFRFRYRSHVASIGANTVPTDPDASRDLIRYTIDDAIDRAFALGRTGGRISRTLEQLRLRTTAIQVPVELTVDREALSDAILAAFQEDLTPAKDAELIIDGSVVPPTVRIDSEKSGIELVLPPAIESFERQAKRLAFQLIEITDRPLAPELTRRELEPLVPEALRFLDRPALTFTFEKQTFPAPRAVFGGWLNVTGTKDAYAVTLDPVRFAQGIRQLATGVEIEAKNGSLVIKDEKIDSFVSGTEGRRIDDAALLSAVLAEWPATSTFAIPTQATQGTLLGEDPERLGIRELLGVGKSNFSGSPSNRRKNIALGASHVNGTIIKPGETFSLLTVLGPIDGEHKWLPELVIKGNETKPEFGGGLCQIGTTSFRGALAAGLPIVERRNHSYRVRYYEPAGTDATIYDPSPDFRFLNDTQHSVLISANIVGDDVVFEFWGTKDGRVAEQTKPRIYNIVAPPPLKLVETLDLAPGKKKCTETAHAGADAEFTYTVTYPNGEVKKEVFQSHYRPWQAVCLVGVEKLTEPVDATTQESAVN